MKRFLLLATLIGATTAAAQDVEWQTTPISGLVASDSDYVYNIKTTLGAISDTMFQVSHMTKDSSTGLAAFCVSYSNLGRTGSTLLVEKNTWRVYMPSSDFKFKQVRDRLVKNTPSDIAFALSYACLDTAAEQNGRRQTLSIPDGATVQLPYPTLTLQMKFAGAPDGRIVTTIVR